MPTIKDGGPAFPVQDHTNEWGYAIQPGMSLRDWHAGQSLPAIIAATSAGMHMPKMRESEEIRFAIARDAYEMADAMLAARQEGS